MLRRLRLRLLDLVLVKISGLLEWRRTKVRLRLETMLMDVDGFYLSTQICGLVGVQG